MQHGTSPNYLSDLLLQHTEHPYPLRNLSDIPNIHCNTQSYASSILPLTIQQWNSLPEDIKQCGSSREFKSKLSIKTSKAKPHLSHGCRKTQVYHTRLRLGCSSLNFDLHRRNLVPSPLYISSEIETSHHYLIQCPRHNLSRLLYLSNLTCVLTLNNHDRKSPE